MTFLTPLFLIGALAGAIPVLLHLIHRRRANELPFPTLRFLRISVEKTRRRRRIQDLLLMLLRAAAVMLLAVGLARPTITNIGALWGSGSRSAVVIVLDNSASMGTIDPNRPRLVVARDAARQILDQLGDGDQAALLVTGGPQPTEPPRLERTQESIRQRLAACQASYTVADLGAAIDQARDLLAASDAANRQIYVITDMQARSWQSLSKPGDSENAEGATDQGATAGSPGSVTNDEIPIIVVDCHDQPKPNVALGNVRLDVTLPIARLPVRATVDLHNSSPIPQQRRVELYVDGDRRAASPAIELPAEGHAQHEFFFTFDTGGIHRCEARLAGDDSLSLDDRRHFAAVIDREVPVAIVSSGKHEIDYLDDTFYLRQALAPGESTGSAIRATMLDAASLASEPLSTCRVVFCVNLPAPGEAAAARLRRYVASGGNLLWICGDHVDAEQYNRMNAAAEHGLLPGRLLGARAADDDPTRDSWHVTLLDGKHPALAELAEMPSLYESILVYRHMRIDTEKTPGAWVLARLDDGECLLAERRIGAGRVLLLGTSCHVSQTNLPLRPVFLPLLMRLTHELAGGARAERELLCGSPLSIDVGTPPSPGATGTASPVHTIEIEHPSGERIRPSIDAPTGATNQDATGVPPVPHEPPPNRSTLGYTDTHEPGIYLVRPLAGGPGAETTVVSVNMDTDEADWRAITADELTALVPDSPLIVADDPSDLADVFRQLREGYSLWEPLLAVVLLLLIGETLLANRFVPKPTASGIRTDAQATERN